MTTIGMTLPRSRILTDELMRPPPPARPEAEVDAARAYLGEHIPPLVAAMSTRGVLTVRDGHITRALTDPAFCTVDGGFEPSPVTCRRSVGALAVARCARATSRSPSEAVAAVLDDATSSQAATASQLPWWAPWFSTLPDASRAVVRAEAVTWATNLWTALEWSRLPRAVELGGNSLRWSCPWTGRVILRSRPDLRVRVAGRPVSLVMAAGSVPGAWRAQLGFPALVAGLAYGADAVPARVVGFWPASGQSRVWEPGADSLREAAEATVSVLSLWTGSGSQSLHIPDSAR